MPVPGILSPFHYCILRHPSDDSSSRRLNRAISDCEAFTCDMAWRRHAPCPSLAARGDPDPTASTRPHPILGLLPADDPVCLASTPGRFIADRRYLDAYLVPDGISGTRNLAATFARLMARVSLGSDRHTALGCQLSRRLLYRATGTGAHNALNFTSRNVFPVLPFMAQSSDLYPDMTWTRTFIFQTGSNWRVERQRRAAMKHCRSRSPEWARGGRS